MCCIVSTGTHSSVADAEAVQVCKNEKCVDCMNYMLQVEKLLRKSCCSNNKYANILRNVTECYAITPCTYKVIYSPSS